MVPEPFSHHTARWFWQTRKDGTYLLRTSEIVRKHDTQCLQLTISSNQISQCWPDMLRCDQELLSIKHTLGCFWCKGEPQGLAPSFPLCYKCCSLCTLFVEVCPVKREITLPFWKFSYLLKWSKVALFIYCCYQNVTMQQNRKSNALFCKSENMRMWKKYTYSTAFLYNRFLLLFSQRREEEKRTKTSKHEKISFIKMIRKKSNVDEIKDKSWARNKKSSDVFLIHSLYWIKGKLRLLTIWPL